MRPAAEDEGSLYGDDEMEMDLEFLEAVERVEQEAAHQISQSHSLTAPRDVIVIETDSEDDKENVPVPQRHVRRRTGEVVTLNSRGSDAEDIIEIFSDED